MAASVELLKAARAKIADPANWIVGAYARDADGMLCHSRASEATRFCTIGAVMASGGHLFGPEMELLNKLSRERGCHDVSVVNDCRGHRAAIGLLDDAITIAEAEASNA